MKIADLEIKICDDDWTMEIENFLYVHPDLFEYYRNVYLAPSFNPEFSLASLPAFVFPEDEGEKYDYVISCFREEMVEQGFWTYRLRFQT